MGLNLMNYKKGFTLIELLVVISIISILSIVAFVIFSGVNKKSDDVRRKSDVIAIAKAYENKFSPSLGQYQTLADSQFTSGQIPLDPSGQNYFNQLSANSIGFRVCAALSNNPAQSCSTPADDCYCVDSIQGTYVSGSPAPSPSSSPSPPPPSPSPSPLPSPSPSPPPPCALTSANWSASSVQEGTQVTLTVVGDTNCSSSDVMAFNIRENDTAATDDDFSPDPTPTYTDAIKTWAATWNTVYIDDSDDPFSDPGDEYFFKADLNGDDSFESNPRILQVTQAPPPNQAPSCVSAPTGPSSLNTSQAGLYTSTATDPDGNITGYNFTTSPSSGTPASQNGASATFNWTAPGVPGSVNINLTVTDAGSLQATCPARTVTIIAPSPSPTPTPTPSPSPSPSPTPITIDFESPPTGSLNGQYPTGIINWGTSQWLVGGPYQAMTTKNAWFNSGTSRTFSFVTPKKVVSVLAHTDSGFSSTITLNCPGNFLVSQVVGSNALVTIITNWVNNCTGAVTLTSSAGPDSEFDNLVVQ